VSRKARVLIVPLKLNSLSHIRSVSQCMYVASSEKKRGSCYHRPF
jgi:hypothetical protein